MLCGCDKTFQIDVKVNSTNDLRFSKTFDFEETFDELKISESRFNGSCLYNFKSFDFEEIKKTNGYTCMDPRIADNTSEIYVGISFYLMNSTDKTIKYRLALNGANGYLIDYLRVLIIADDEMTMYKDFEENEKVHDAANECENTKYFEDDKNVFSDLSLDLKANEPKRFIILVWEEEDELYDDEGQRLTGYKDHSYDVNGIDLELTFSD
jgi:hypothetical protein